ncbi:hypothetical protein SMF913_12108 [Streptomyces malaysiensis]|uniref:Uncharacterized protein n=1 Tax=Streptomyces malaysiensis TaxID=92644 RepID=A0A2J7Z734_STRMQ|nr:hypothetical protein SMF913_12108 [Streptomyces malaysiensis]
MEDAAAVLGELLAERGPASFDLVFADGVTLAAVKGA